MAPTRIEQRLRRLVARLGVPVKVVTSRRSKHQLTKVQCADDTLTFEETDRHTLACDDLTPEDAAAIVADRVRRNGR